MELDPRTRGQRPEPRLPDAGREGLLQDQLRDRPALAARTRRRPRALYRSGRVAEPLHPRRCREMGDRKSVVSGKSVSVRVDLGGSRIIKKTKHKQHQMEKNKRVRQADSNQVKTRGIIIKVK